jgi:hypothetical protein
MVHPIFAHLLQRSFPVTRSKDPQPVSLSFGLETRFKETVEKSLAKSKTGRLL